MGKESIKNLIGQPIFKQILNLVPRATFNINVLWSWGIAEQRAMNFRNMPSLGIRVNGYKHKGWVIISLNEGKDLYNIYLLDKFQAVKQTIEDVYAEDLEILDTLIETGEMNEQEYKDKVNSIYYLDAVKLLNL
jgi:hypothetical protein